MKINPSSVLLAVIAVGFAYWTLDTAAWVTQAYTHQVHAGEVYRRRHDRDPFFPAHKVTVKQVQNGYVNYDKNGWNGSDSTFDFNMLYKIDK